MSSHFPVLGNLSVLRKKFCCYFFRVEGENAESASSECRSWQEECNAVDVKLFAVACVNYTQTLTTKAL